MIVVAWLDFGNFIERTTEATQVPSGDPFWDDSAIRAILKASPLPPPPGRPGEWNISFPSRELL